VSARERRSRNATAGFGERVEEKHEVDMGARILALVPG
jgi:hypothetical protein